MSKDETIIEGGGNVFDDLGMPDAAAELVKAQLTFQIAKRIKVLGLTQTAAAARLGISQPDISRLMNRRPTGFSTDRLLAVLIALDIDVDIVLRPTSVPAHTAKVNIREELPICRRDLTSWQHRSSLYGRSLSCHRSCDFCRNFVTEAAIPSLALERHTGEERHA